MMDLHSREFSTILVLPVNFSWCWAKGRLSSGTCSSNPTHYAVADILNLNSCGCPNLSSRAHNSNQLREIRSFQQQRLFKFHARAASACSGSQGTRLCYEVVTRDGVYPAWLCSRIPKPHSPYSSIRFSHMWKQFCNYRVYTSLCDFRIDQ